MDYTSLTVMYSFSKLDEAFKAVLTKLQNLRDDIKVHDSDGRQVGLYGMQEGLLAFGLTAHAIAGTGLRSRMRSVAEVKESLENYVTIKGRTQEQLKTMMETVWRLSVLSHFHFKMDALFQNLLEALGANPGTTGFTKNMQQLFSRITLNDPARDRDVITAATFIRNSLHNNGIHRGADWGPFTVNGLTYEFKKNQDVRCASFGHLLSILDATVDVLRDVLLSSEVRALPRVEDLYALLNPT